MHYSVWQIVNYPVLLEWQWANIFVKLDFTVWKVIWWELI